MLLHKIVSASLIHLKAERAGNCFQFTLRASCRATAMYAMSASPCGRTSPTATAVCTVHHESVLVPLSDQGHASLSCMPDWSEDTHLHEV